MAWCPKCKNEYVDGFTHCPDCDVDLVDVLREEEELKYIPAETFENVEEIITYLHKVSVNSASLTHLEEEDIDAIAVSKKEYSDAKLHLSVYLQNEAAKVSSKSDSTSSKKNTIEETADMNPDSASEKTISTDQTDIHEDYNSDNEAPTSGSGHIYTKLSDKYEDVKSSAYTLLVVGIIGGITILLEAFGVFTIPISSQTKWLFYTVMGGIFIAFIISGIISMMHAKQLKIDAEKEDALIEKIISWFQENYTKETIDDAIDTDIQEELLYFNRADFIKNVIMHEFEEADEALVESLIENIYSDLYE